MDEIQAEATQTDDIEELGRLFTEYVEEEERLKGKRKTEEGCAWVPTEKRARDDETG